MSTSGVTSRLMTMFRRELEDRVDRFEQDLLAAETASSEADRAETIHSLFRGAHSVKGAASAVGRLDIEQACHRLEDLLTDLRDGRLHLDPAIIDLLLDAATTLRAAGRSLGSEGDDATGFLAALSARLENALAPPRAGQRRRETGEPDKAIDPGETPAAALRSSEGAHPGSRDDAVRVDAEKLDRLLECSSDMLVAVHRGEPRHREILALRDLVRRLRDGETAHTLSVGLDRLADAVIADSALLDQAARRVDAEVHSIRMLPFATACEGLDRLVRDTARAAGKKVRLEVQGGQIELDRSILEGLRESLIHLVRNSIDHGIEVGDERDALGKPQHGTVTVTAALRGSGVEVTVADDGAGLDIAAIRRRAREMNVGLEAGDVADTIFLPGISTTREVTVLSGRGVGLDAVRQAIDRLRGSSSVFSVQGQGTRFVLALPLTLTTLRVVLFELQGRTFAIDASAVERVARIDIENVMSIEGSAVIVGDGPTVPLVPFEAVLDLPFTPTLNGRPLWILIVARDEQRIALRVDAIVEEREVVVRSLGPRLAAAPAIAGAAILGDGSIALIVRTDFTLERAFQREHVFRPSAPARTVAVQRRVLLVDDSITTRALECSILEAAGYDVVTAGDGEEALRILGQTDVDVVISDIEMPRMDGFELTRAIRGSDRLRDLAVVLVTARGSDADKRRGIDAGADAYIVKSAFEQEAFLETVGRL